MMMSSLQKMVTFAQEAAWEAGEKSRMAASRNDWTDEDIEVAAMTYKNVLLGNVRWQERKG